MKRCIQCKQLLDKSEFDKDNLSYHLDGLNTICKDCVDKEQEKYKQNLKKRRQQIYESKQQRQKSYYYKNREELKKLHKRYEDINKEIVFQIYSDYSMKCRSCGEEDIDVLVIDHINGNGADHRRELRNLKNVQFTGNKVYQWLIKNFFPEGYQVLCRNCDWRKFLELDMNR